jgi:predicted nucleotidyltransferase
MDEMIQKVLDIIIKEVDPEMIILFGSRSREDHDANSDIDLLIIGKNIVHPRKTLKKVYEKLDGILIPLDLILVDEDRMKEHIDDPYMIYGEALKEGRTLYARA